MKIKILSIICLVFSLMSCNKWLDIDLANKVDEGKLFSTEQGFYEALAGVYSEMSKSNLYGGRLTFEYIDLYAQYFSQTSVSTEYEKHVIYDYTNASVKSVHAAIWSDLYNCIAAANNILLWADKNSDVLSEESRNQVKGEATALRAFLHFDLYRMFSPDMKRDPKEKGIAYNKIFGVSLPHLYTAEESVQLILNDLLEAERLLANDVISNAVPFELEDKNYADKFVARMNLYAVKAMIARVHQARGDNQNAALYAKQVIESGKFQLLDFKSVNQDENMMDVLFSDEHIFSLRNNKISETIQPLFYRKEENGVTTFAKLSFANTSVIYEGNNDDVRNIKWFNLGDYKKYSLTDNEKFFPKIPLIKLSEMYLIVTESLLATDSDQALTYINTLRDHRIINNSHWNYLTKDYIYEEMKREYLGEGQLWFVYKRNNIGTVSTTDGSTFAPSNTLFVFPLPDKEIETGNRN